MNRRSNVVVRPVSALVLALVLAGTMQAQTQVKPGFNLFSPQQDVEIGQQSAVQAEQQMPLLNDSQVQSYVSNIGQKLARNAGGPQFEYRFRVINASDINAFALPGGYVYINRGVLENAKNEGEVAGVIAHEIAHVSLRHGTHQASKAYAAQAGLSILGGILGGRAGQGTANILNTVGGVGMNVLFLRFSRELETQADIRGAQILAASGYAPADMVSFFQTLASVDKSKKTTFLSDHPAPPDRIKRIQQEASALRVTANPTTNVAELNTIKGRLNSAGRAPTAAEIQRGMVSSSGNTSNGSRSRASGPVATNVPRPSTSLQTFRSPSGLYSVAYPSNWRVYQQGDSGATIAPEGGILQSGDRTEIVYGVVVNHYDPFNNNNASRLRGSNSSSNATIESATSDLIAQVRQGSAHLRPVSNSTQRFNLDGGNALATSLRGVNPATGIDERLTVVTRQLRDSHLVYMLFVTPQADASNYGSLLQAMVNSIQVAENH